MLALTHPDIAARMTAVPSGLFPIRPDGKLSLAIKASKEALVAIRENGGFAVYVVPVPARDGIAISLVTAFFDDADEPLVIRTPLFCDETPSMETVALLTGEEMDLYRLRPFSTSDCQGFEPRVAVILLSHGAGFGPSR